MNEAKSAIFSHCRNGGRGLAAVPELGLLSLDGGENSHSGSITCKCGAVIQMEVSKDGQEAEITFGHRPASPAGIH